MNWPTYPNPGIHEALQNHADHVAGYSPRPGRPGRLGAAIDVYRAGLHLWSSYECENPEFSETVDDWTYRYHFDELGTEYPREYDMGPWGVPGVHLDAFARVPKPEAARWIGGAQNVCDLLATCLAVGQLPNAPEGLDNIMKPHVIHSTLSRDKDGWAVFTVSGGDVVVRAFVTYCANPHVAAEEAKGVTWRARLERRKVRGSWDDAPQLQEREATFTAPRDAKPNVLIRKAKAEFDLTGAHAQRQTNTLIWNVTGAPYKITVTQLTETPDARNVEAEKETGQ